MKLDLTSLYFNGSTESLGNTAGWGTSLGQKKGNEITVPGGKELISLMENPLNKFIFDPVNNINHKADFNNLDKKKYPYSATFLKVFVNGNLFEGPFHLIVVEDTPEALKTEKHWGRKNLKYNPDITINGKSNNEFYKKIQNLFGDEACWFAYDISAINDELHILVINVSDKPMLYKDNEERKEHWESLLNDFELYKDQFKKYLLEIHKLKNISSANEYIKNFPKVKNWFLEKGLCNPDFQIWDVYNDNSKIQNSLKTTFKKDWQKAAQKNTDGDYGFMMAAWNRWTEFIEWRNANYNHKIKFEFNIKDFESIILNTGLNFSLQLINRFIASLLTKPFVICSGLSGSGKTKLAQAFVQWICESEKQYKIIPVGADWTNREPLLGYPNGLDLKSYVTPDSGALHLIIEASKEVNARKPFFLILDEMNLSHVERYFADFLSIMESGDSIKLYTGHDRVDNEGEIIKQEIKWPPNLFIIGTVNIDETTYMFSPKVLDRANVIEFRISPTEMKKFIINRRDLNMKELFIDKDKSKGGAGQNMGESFFSEAEDRKIVKIEDLEGEENNVLITFFEELQNVGSEFGYRSASEIELLITKLGINCIVDDSGLPLNNQTKIDIAIMQKLLPKLHGSRKKLAGPLEKLAGFCLLRKEGSMPDGQNKSIYQQFINDKRDDRKWEIKYPISFEKIERMHKNLIDNGFTSYAEA